jgi:hypothetical protein
VYVYTRDSGVSSAKAPQGAVGVDQRTALPSSWNLSVTMVCGRNASGCIAVELKGALLCLVPAPPLGALSPKLLAWTLKRTTGRAPAARDRPCHPSREDLSWMHLCVLSEGAFELCPLRGSACSVQHILGSPPPPPPPPPLPSLTPLLIPSTHPLTHPLPSPFCFPIAAD